MSVTPLSYNHDLTRDEIIARYRDRIAIGKRSKLGKSDLEQLILHLIDHLKTLDKQAEIKALCDTEIALLEEGYNQSTIAFDYLPKYRKAIKKAIADGIIPTTDNNSHRYIHTQRVTGISEEQFEHYALSYLKYAPQTIDQLWVKYSNGHFGFSVQKALWENLGSTFKQIELFNNEFFNDVFASHFGWKKNTRFLNWEELDYSLNAPQGQLPATWVNSDTVVAANGQIYAAWKRLQDCQSGKLYVQQFLAKTDQVI